jgi:uncharacterized membrane protein (DUF106 family)
MRGDPFGPLSFVVLSFRYLERTVMETEVAGIIIGAVLPLYPMLFVIYQKIGRYDEIVEEFKKLRAEHDAHRENFHGN